MDDDFQPKEDIIVFHHVEPIQAEVLVRGLKAVMLREFDCSA